MSAALRITNNKRKPPKLSKSSESDAQDSRNSSSKSAAKKQRTHLRSPSPSMEIQPGHISSSAPSTLEVATSVANPDPVVTLESESIPEAVVATPDSQCVDSAIKHVPVLHATSSAIDNTSVASNTHLVVPVVSNNPLTITPSHGRYLLPTEKIERLSKKPTRAQVVQITTNLRRDSCHYLPIDVVHPDNYDSFETLLQHQ